MVGIKIMKHLNKHKLDFFPTWKYVQDALDNANTLSLELLSYVNFKDGFFFTLLPPDANIERIYEFESGMVLHQNPEQICFIAGEKSTYAIIPTIRDELSRLILEDIKSKDQLSCIFDDVLHSSNDKFYRNLIFSHGLFYENELYYLIQKNEFSYELIKQCLRASNAFWHSLCILTRANFSNFKKKMNLEMIKEICITAELILIGSYDGEGYVFWEKSS
jgi:hypothetical protein